MLNRSKKSDPQAAQPSCKESLLDNESGLSMLESALVLPIVIALFFAIVQYGFIFGAFISLRNGVAVAVRSSAIATNKISDANISSLIADSSPLLQGNNITVVRHAHRDEPISGFTDITLLEIQYSQSLFFPMVVPQADANGNLQMFVTLTAREN